MATKTADIEKIPPASADEDLGITVRLEPEEEVLTLEEEREDKDVPPKEDEPPKVDAKKEPEQEPVPLKVVTPEPLKADVKPEPIGPIAREERAKRKAATKEREFYKGQWEETEREVQRLQARIQQAGMETKAQPIKVSKERIDALEAKAEKADGLGKVAGLALEETARLIEENDQRWSDRFADFQFRMGIKLSEVSARARHADFDHVLSQGGVFEAMTQRADGTYANPILARLVLQDADPGERAYIIGKGRLIAMEDAKAEAEPKGEAETTAEATREVSAAPQAEAAVKPEPKVDAEAEAERRGARAVVDKVNANSQKAKGISGLRKAGPVGKTATWTREELDGLMRTNPTRYMELVAKYPEIDRYHLG